MRLTKALRRTFAACTARRLQTSRLPA